MRKNIKSSLFNVIQTNVEKKCGYAYEKKTRRDNKNLANEMNVWLNKLYDKLQIIFFKRTQLSHFFYVM